jgi:hypothetical protein
VCHDCIEREEGETKGKGADDSPQSIDQRDNIGLRVQLMYLNTHRADET